MIADPLRPMSLEERARVRALGMLTPAESERLLRLLASRHFLVRNGAGDLREPMPCKRHPRGVGHFPVYHEWLTLCCIPRPWEGTPEGVLRAYGRVSAPRDPHARDPLAGLLDGLPDLSRGHPRLARALQPDADHDLLSVALGVLEPISPARAATYRDSINARGLRPPLDLPSLRHL